MKTPISRHFNYEEFEFSQKANELGIDNQIPSDKIRFSIRLLVLNLLEPLRKIIQRPIIITSGYRCHTLNKAIGGAKNSQHLAGEAVDIHCGGALEVLFLAQVVLRHKLPFDQMILHDSLLHLSFKAHGHQRYQILYNKSYKEAQL
ncbi:MAG: D-Ala-D-Ala carboxypeptidase family metallohydrolase [Bacteroidales bacterium]|nr:D-Ala-D-Ala carboxypeptidase family metallohydrolase [Bacteroidales bacterium]